MKKGDLFTTPMAPSGGISVRRVARDGSWADIAVISKYSMYAKRQPLKDGAFSFEVQQVEGLIL